MIGKVSVATEQRLRQDLSQWMVAKLVAESIVESIAA